MIALQRDRTPAAIAPTYRIPGRDPHLLHLLDVQLKRKKLNQGVWKNVKDQLKRESRGKCAYCEMMADLGMHGDVEHIRPKSVYWWLAYCYDNYAFSCQLCNQKFKGDQFPLAGQRMAAPVVPDPPTDAELAALARSLSPDPLDQQAVDEYIAACLAEQPGIPDPYVVDPEPLFAWVADDNLREVEIRARDDTPESQQAFSAVVAALGLNRQELKGARYFHYRLLQLPILTLKTNQTAEARRVAEETLREQMGPHAPFAGMARYFVRDVEGLAL